MLTLDLESGLPLFLQADGVILEEGSAIIPLCLESGSTLLLQDGSAILEEGSDQGSAIIPLCLESGSTLLLQDGSAILEEGSIFETFLDLESGSHLLTESLLRLVA